MAESRGSYPEWAQRPFGRGESDVRIYPLLQLFLMENSCEMQAVILRHCSSHLARLFSGTVRPSIFSIKLRMHIDSLSLLAIIKEEDREWM